jgi:hypothetical protein
LGAATRLHQHGHTDWLLLDQVMPAAGLRKATTPALNSWYHFAAVFDREF